jgi:predicted Zn-dependent protease
VRGRRYLNSALRISFTAPDGFSLESARDMVIGIGGNGSQALRFESVTLKADQTLASYVASGWIDGVETGPVQEREIGGLPGAVATGKGKDWSFGLAAVQAGDRVYRFILAARGNAAPERPLEALLSSFHALSASEAQAARPLQIRIVTAAAGDTPASMAARMQGQDRALELFVMLNGLDRNKPLVPGQRYKIVAE